MNVYLNKIKESWIIDRIRKDWYENNKDISTNYIRQSNIFWIISPWVWKSISKKALESKKVLCSHYHFDFNNFNEKDFYHLDSYVDEYHVISLKTKEQLEQLTDKKITSIPFWINQKDFYYKANKIELRKNLGFKPNQYLVGSFQRDTESHDLKSPKLIKGPDIFLDIVSKLNLEINNLCVVLAGKNRNYLIDNLKKNKIKFKYFEMADFLTLNNLYNILDLYIVSSRIEGGPQAILEAAHTKTPIVSTDVGVAGEILSSESIYKINNFSNSKPNIEFAFERSKDYTIPNGMKKFRTLLDGLNES